MSMMQFFSIFTPINKDIYYCMYSFTMLQQIYLMYLMIKLAQWNPKAKLQYRVWWSSIKSLKILKNA